MIANRQGLSRAASVNCLTPGFKQLALNSLGIHWPTAVAMFLGGSLGTWLSAKYSKKLGNEKIRYLFLTALKILIF